MSTNRLTFVVKSPLREQDAVRSAESPDEKAHWLKLADAALHNHNGQEHNHNGQEIKPGRRAHEEHERLKRELQKAVEKHEHRKRAA